MRRDRFKMKSSQDFQEPLKIEKYVLEVSPQGKQNLSDMFQNFHDYYKVIEEKSRKKVSHRRHTQNCESKKQSKTTSQKNTTRRSGSSFKKMAVNTVKINKIQPGAALKFKRLTIGHFAELQQKNKR